MAHTAPYDGEKEKRRGPRHVDVPWAEFTHNQSQRDTIDTTAQLENKVEAAIELSASFVVYVAGSISEDQSTILVPRYSLTCSNILRQLILRQTFILWHPLSTSMKFYLFLYLLSSSRLSTWSYSFLLLIYLPGSWCAYGKLTLDLIYLHFCMVL